MSLKAKRKKVLRARRQVKRSETKLPKSYPLKKKVRASYNRLVSLLRRSAKKLKKKNPWEEGRIIPRKDWGAAPPQGPLGIQKRVERRVLHHTAYRALSPLASQADEVRRMRQIQADHFGRGFSDIGYHAVVFPSGRIYEGRESQYVGAGVVGYNNFTIHVAADGNYSLDGPTRSLVQACWRAFKFLPGGNKKLYGHRDLESNICPGDFLYDRIGEIR